MAEVDRAQILVPPPALFARTAAVERARHQWAGAPPVYAPPVFSAFSPISGSVTRTAAIGFSVTDPVGFDTVFIWAELASGVFVMVYDGSSFSSGFDTGSSVSGTTTLAFSVQYDAPGWTENYTLRANATNANGVSSTASSAYTLSNPPAPPDATVPTVAVVSPTPPGPIGRNDAVRLRVTDGGVLKRAWLFVTMGGEQYVVHNGYSFRPAYATGSTRISIEGGYEFVVLRTGGWLAAPSFEVQAIDDAGNER